MPDDNNPTDDRPADADFANDNAVAPAGGGPRSWTGWPHCPECSDRRRARCSICGSVGIDFRLASVDTDETPSRVLLMCPTCDDHFRPEFERYCERCSHDFGDGFETDAEEGSTGRALIIITGLVTVFLALGGYFWRLVR